MRITNSTGTESAAYSQMQNTAGANQDSRLKSIQNQIENVQQQMQSLANYPEMSAEEKMNRRKELQQKLQDLNRQMAQRKMEIQQEQREKASAKDRSQKPVQGNNDQQDPRVMRTPALQEMISADASMKRAKTVQSVKIGMEGKAGVLESEIKMDRSRGGATEKKEAELAELKDRIHIASGNMMAQMSDVNTALEKSGTDQQGQPSRGSAGVLVEISEEARKKLAFNKVTDPDADWRKKLAEEQEVKQAVLEEDQ
ncbi:FlxA-like family protein [Acetonema longum]|uniref:Uncharacterized protein n=1 Tax=Acetonema longum DSM 6540 TaxID=1009370 RepID=F7NGA8_9FIRM|nr:FlxA-like family protein [Acetonema longum]EGO64922.1 hypothetical protein ALO_04953 [Acetonema longum DSM 6540]